MRGNRRSEGDVMKPVQIHILSTGLAVCRFSNEIPSRWEFGNIWIRAEELPATTRACLDPQHPIHHPMPMEVCNGCLVATMLRERKPCEWCEEPIEADDAYISPSWPNGPVYHHTCLVRSIVGSVAHLERRCHCFVRGSVEDDPPGMTRRQGARKAAELWKRMHPEATDG